MTRRPRHRARTGCAVRLQGRLRDLAVWDSDWERAHVFYLWEADDAEKIMRQAPYFAHTGPGYYLGLGDGPLEMIGLGSYSASRFVNHARKLARPKREAPSMPAIEVVSAVLGLLGAGMSTAASARDLFRR